MPIDDEDELAVLRRRAYAPGGDISSDPRALDRLLELEARARALHEPPAPPGEESDPAGEGIEAPADGEIPDAIPARPRSARLRRSTVVLLAGAALIAATLVTLLVLVQRIQPSPLPAGATQIARLSPDPDFEVPSSFLVGARDKVTAYEAFEGFRVLSRPSPFDGEGAAPCMTVWQPALLVTISGGGYSYNGEYFSSVCGAGVFSATSTVLLREDTPERDQTDFPAGTALQFVYDETADQVLVFRG